MAKKGSILTDEQKRIMQEGRARAKAEKIANGEPLRAKKVKSTIVNGKVNLYLTGNEVNAFDLVSPIREVMRPLNKYMECRAICNQIRMSTMWQNIHVILDMISTTFNIVYPEIKSDKKIKKERKKRNWVMSEEHKAKLKAGRATSRVAKGL